MWPEKFIFNAGNIFLPISQPARRQGWLRIRRGRKLLARRRKQAMQEKKEKRENGK
ncbi:hypothetical protein P4S93_06245 [Aneurinibacillus thermoaerophilus]|uniref:Uncharacterized protein n=1 Tax=Aneurinibacillus thermoaerophilus TaxID=143495 RepID=A0ABX8YEE2_ANETH|nr:MULTISPECIES: hypothetical protein [Aneurinibacillus]MED0674935.1 hypothetical protein [Aneurinibacillus thermoaerophilus]MED0756187.1 hypothetical protein [Aneurinibacillus thermoaerophilus]MED0760378.1 hypothetical protein [Aneurinibacillus thermoaerophilus]QYY43881.1 hypothetical protein K3F53_06700 [Aneurinibacillus thermoaerophilus]